MTDLDKARQVIDDVDREMTRLFEQRMDAVRQIAEYKKEHGMPVEDADREKHILEMNAERVRNGEYRSYYVRFLRSIMDLSKHMQHRLLDETDNNEEV